MEGETSPDSSPVQTETTRVAGVEEASTSHHRGRETSDRPENLRRFPHRRMASLLSYRISGAVFQAHSRDEVLSCLVLLLTFCFLVCMTLIMGFYGSLRLELGPNCSRLITSSALFVNSIEVEALGESKPGAVLYGFFEAPPMDVETSWNETHTTSVPTNLHREWMFFLNKGSAIHVHYTVESQSSAPLLLAIAKGRESLVEWINDPSYPNTTLSWNIIHGTGKIEQEITSSSAYYIAVGNLNSEEVEVELNFAMKSFMYNTSQAYYRCFLGEGLCSVKLSLLRSKTALLTSAPHNEDSTTDDDQYVKLYYGPRWLTYLIGSGSLIVVLLLAYRFCNTGGFRSADVAPERSPLLIPKDEDTSSWGSSYDSVSGEEEDFLDGTATLDGKNYGNNDANHHRLCVICLDSQRDCFFLPCGHCAACFACGTRIAEESGLCPICRRKMKKVRKIFTV